jgi:hypothetical protein
VASQSLYIWKIASLAEIEISVRSGRKEYSDVLLSMLSNPERS